MEVETRIEIYRKAQRHNRHNFIEMKKWTETETEKRVYTCIYTEE